MATKTINAEPRGPFIAGDIPEPVVMQFNRPSEQGGGPVNLTGFDSFKVWRRYGEDDDAASNQSFTEHNAAIHAADEGKVKYVPVPGDFDQAGTYDFLFTIASGSTLKLTAAKVIRLHFVDRDDI